MKRKIGTLLAAALLLPALFMLPGAGAARVQDQAAPVRVAAAAAQHAATE